MPLWLHEQGLDEIVVDRLHLDETTGPADLSRMGGRWSMPASIRSTRSRIAVVGKYVDHKDAYKSLAEALKHGGLRQRTRVKLKWLESERDRARRRRRALDGRRRHPGAGRLRRPRLRGQGADRAIRARARRAVFRHLLRHAGGGGRRRAPPRRPRRRQQHRERQALAASGDRPDHRVAHRRPARSSAAARTATSAAPCAWACRSSA